MLTKFLISPMGFHYHEPSCLAARPARLGDPRDYYYPVNPHDLPHLRNRYGRRYLPCPLCIKEYKP